MSASTASQAATVLARPDQWAVRRDLEVFFGPRAAKFLPLYDKACARSGRARFAVLSWCWPACNFSFAWFFYRKLYGAGAVLLFLPIALNFAFGAGWTFALGLFYSVMAKSIYVQAAVRRVARADRLGLTGDEREAYLRGAGGVSFSGALLACTVFGCLLLLKALASFGLHHQG